MTAARAIPVACFFVPFAIGLFGTRFFGLRALQRLPAPVLSSLGLAGYGLGFATLALAHSVLAVVAGTLFGFAYGLVGPTAIA